MKPRRPLRSLPTGLVSAALAVMLSTASDSSAGAGEAPALSADRALTRIAFGSCADQRLPQPIWDTVVAAEPDLFLFLGDNVYGDVSSGALDELRDAYARLSRVPGFRRLRATTPLMAIWDDHDYGVNDGGADFPHRGASEALFLRFWEVPPTAPRARREGLYEAAVFGPPGRRVQVILLDTRWFRSPLAPTDERNARGREHYRPDPDPTKTMLGPAQWDWFEARLGEPAELRLLVSSVQVLADGHGYERWGNLPAERRRLVELIAKTGANGVVLLSGDRHFGALYRRTGGTPYPLHEVTSSSLNRPSRRARESGPHQIGAAYGAENFGLVRIDWERGRIALELRALDGSAARRLRVDLDTLR